MRWQARFSLAKPNLHLHLSGLLTNGPTNEFGREQKDVEGRERTKREMGRSNMHEWARERERERERRGKKGREE